MKWIFKRKNKKGREGEDVNWKMKRGDKMGKKDRSDVETGRQLAMCKVPCQLGLSTSGLQLSTWHHHIWRRLPFFWRNIFIIFHEYFVFLAFFEAEPDMMLTSEEQPCLGLPSLVVTMSISHTWAPALIFPARLGSAIINF